MFFLRDHLWKIVKWFLFKLDAERAHRLTVRLIQIGSSFGKAPLRLASGLHRKEEISGFEGQFPKVFGFEFKSRVGLAAGFDKNAEILTALPALGFGFAEVGTITPRPQPGNDLPRLFRDPKNSAIFNRMGFNGLGAEIVSRQLARARENLPLNFRVGVNLGKNKDTPLENAWEDYVLAAKAFEGLADYLVINVSSPNTPGLRSLQSIESLRPIVNEVVQLIGKWKVKPPLLIKVAPEIESVDLAQLIQTVEPWGVDGWILTNTLGGEMKAGEKTLAGGWSGKPLSQLSRKRLVEARKATQKAIISVGGILSAEEAEERLNLGADLIQIYTGWIFQGPSFPVILSRKVTKGY